MTETLEQPRQDMEAKRAACRNAVARAASSVLAYIGIGLDRSLYDDLRPRWAEPVAQAYAAKAGTWLLTWLDAQVWDKAYLAAAAYVSVLDAYDPDAAFDVAYDAAFAAAFDAAHDAARTYARRAAYDKAHRAGDAAAAAYDAAYGTTYEAYEAFKDAAKRLPLRQDMDEKRAFAARASDAAFDAYNACNAVLVAFEAPLEALLRCAERGQAVATDAFEQLDEELSAALDACRTAAAVHAAASESSISASEAYHAAYLAVLHAEIAYDAAYRAARTHSPATTAGTPERTRLGRPRCQPARPVAPGEPVLSTRNYAEEIDGLV